MAGGGGFIPAGGLPSGEMPNTVAAPVQIYDANAGAAAARNNDVAQFLQGLGKLKAPVTETLEQWDKNAGDEQEAQARMKALSASPADLRKEIDSGNYFGLPHKRAQTALRVLDAQNRVYDVSSQLDAMQQRGELVGEEGQAKVRQLVADHTAGVEDDPLAAKQFQKGMLPVLQRYQTVAQTQAISQDQANKQAKLYGYMTAQQDQVDRDAQNAGPTTPEMLTEAHKKAMFRTADFAKNDLLMSQPDIEKVFGNAAQRFAAQGNTAALAALGTYDRGGAKLADKYGAQWQTWTKQAETTRDNNAKKATNEKSDSLEARALRADEKPDDFNKAVDTARAADPTNFGEARAQRLKDQFAHVQAQRQKAATTQMSAQQEAQAEREFVETGARAVLSGNGYMIPDSASFVAADGKERTYARKDYSQKLYDRAEAMVDAQAKDGGWTPEQTAAAKIRLYGQNGDVHPVYQRMFNDLYAGSRAGVPANPEQLPQRLAQLEMLRTTDPGQFRNLAGERDTKQQTWVAAYNGARDFGSDPERAFAIANQRVFNPTASERLNASALNEKVDDVLKKFASSGVLAGPIARQKAVDAINIQLAAGVPDKDIADKAATALNNSHVIANGVPVHNTIPGVGDPRVAKEYLEDAARYFKASNKNLKDQPFQVAFADDPAKPGSYIAIRADTMERISRTGLTGSRLKDYVLQNRSVEHNDKKHWSEWYKRGGSDTEAPPPSTPQLSGD